MKEGMANAKQNKQNKNFRKKCGADAAKRNKAGVINGDFKCIAMLSLILTKEAPANLCFRNDNEPVFQEYLKRLN